MPISAIPRKGDYRFLVTRIAKVGQIFCILGPNLFWPEFSIILEVFTIVSDNIRLLQEQSHGIRTMSDISQLGAYKSWASLSLGFSWPLTMNKRVSPSPTSPAT